MGPLAGSYEIRVILSEAPFEEEQADLQGLVVFATYLLVSLVF